MRLKNKVAIVTGGANGIGLSIVTAFAREGAAVVLSDIDEAKLKQEAQHLAASGAQALAVKADVGNTEDVKNLIQPTIETFGKVDILVYNAAVPIPGNIMEMPESDWDTLMNINVKSLYRTIKETLPHMIEQKSGSIMNISSTPAVRSRHYGQLLRAQKALRTPGHPYNRNADAVTTRNVDSLIYGLSGWTSW